MGRSVREDPSDSTEAPLSHKEIHDKVQNGKLCFAVYSDKLRVDMTTERPLLL